MLSTTTILDDLERLANSENLRVSQYTRPGEATRTFFDLVRAAPESDQYLLVEQLSRDGYTRGETVIFKQSENEGTPPLTDEEYERYCAVVKKVAATRIPGESSRYLHIGTALSYGTTIG